MAASFIAVAFAAQPGIAAAQPILIADSGDTGWLLAASVLVLGGGLAGFGALSGRRDLAGVAAVAALVWAVIGYSLAFGEGTALLGGTASALLGNLNPLLPEATVPESGFALFEMALAIFAALLLASGSGPRASSGWLIVTAALWTLLVYVPIVRWVGGTWLADLGSLDYGGGIAVMTSAGSGALVLAVLVRNDPLADVPGSATAALWLAVLGIAGGAALAASDEAASAILAAQLSAAAGAVAWGFADRLRDPGSLSRGALAGLAAALAGAAYTGIAGAILLGFVAGLAGFGASLLLQRWGRGGATHGFAMFGVGGIVGALLLPLAASPALGGGGVDGGASFVAQAIAVGVVVLWSGALTAISALAVSMVLPIRSIESPVRDDR